MSALADSGPGKAGKKIIRASSTPNPTPHTSENTAPRSIHSRLMDPNSDIYRPMSYAKQSLAPTAPTAPIPSPRATAQTASAVNPAPQLPVLASAVALANVTSEEVEELRDRLFKLTSDYQRLYGVFMPNGGAGFAATRWKTIDLDFPFLFNVHERIMNLLIATRRVENGENVKNDRAFLASQRMFFGSLVGVVASAIDRLSWLRRDLEGPNGYEYPYDSWYYQVIGNNPLSTNFSAVQGPFVGADNGGEERAEKRQKI